MRHSLKSRADRLKVGQMARNRRVTETGKRIIRMNKRHTITKVAPLMMSQMAAVSMGRKLKKRMVIMAYSGRG